MGQKKTISCACGQTHIVDTPQAGSILQCHCGRQIQVPTLREIAQLPAAEQTEGTEQISPRRWTHRQGILFAIGAAVVLLASGIAASLVAGRPPGQLPGKAAAVADLDSRLSTLNPTETLELWRFHQSAPDFMVSIAKKTHSMRKTRQTYTLAAWTIGLVGIAVGITCIALSLRSKKPRHIS